MTTRHVSVLALLAAMVMAGPLWATTVEDIETSVCSNVSALGGVSATVDETYTDYEPSGVNDWDQDWSYAEDKWETGSTLRFRRDGTGTDTRVYYIDGNTFQYSLTGESGSWSYYPEEDMVPGVKYHLMDWVWLFNNCTFTLAGQTEVVNGVTCYKLTSTDYTMWVDVSTETKVIKVSHTGGEYIVWSGYSYLENTAYMFDTRTYYDGSGGSELTELSSIDIAQTFPSSTWTHDP